MKKLEYLEMINQNYGMIYGGSIGKMHDISRRVYKVNYISPTIHTLGGGNTGAKILTNNNRIRKLTPRECWRLMDFDDEDFDRCEAAGVSNTQLYKQAGNSIVVSVLEEILKEIIKEEEEKKTDSEKLQTVPRVTKKGKQMIKLKGVDETILVDLIRVMLDSGYRPVITFAEVGRDTPLSEGLYDVAIITNGEDR